MHSNETLPLDTLLDAPLDTRCGYALRGAEKHEIYVAAVSGHLFCELFWQGWGGMAPHPTGSATVTPCPGPLRVHLYKSKSESDVASDLLHFFPVCVFILQRWVSGKRSKKNIAFALIKRTLTVLIEYSAKVGHQLFHSSIMYSFPEVFLQKTKSIGAHRLFWNKNNSHQWNSFVPSPFIFRLKKQNYRTTSFMVIDVESSLFCYEYDAFVERTRYACPTGTKQSFNR